MTNTIIKKFFYLLGIFSTFNAAMINIGNGQLAILNFILLILIVLQIYYKKGHIIFYKYKSIMFFIFIIFLVSSLGSFYFLNVEWSKQAMLIPVKYILLLFPIFILYNDKELNYYKKYFFKGLYVSTCVQLIWEVFQVVLWKLYSFSLNEYVFQNLLNVKTTHTWTFFDGQAFRPTGISWEPANLAMALVIGFILSKNLISKLFFSIGIILSTSRTGIIIWILCIIIYFLIYLKKNLFTKRSLLFIKKKYIFYIIFIFGFFIIFFVINKKYIFEYLNDSFSRFSSNNESSTSSTLTHIGYYKLSFDIFTKENIFQFLFGYGTTIAGYPYSKYCGIYAWLGPWTPESDFINLLIGNGVIGFFAYYIFMIKNIIYNKNNIDEFLVLLSILLGGILYIYIGNTWCLLVCIILFIKPKHSDI